MCSNPWYGFILRIELKYSKEGFKDGKGSRIAIMRSGQTPLVCSAWRRLRIPHGTLQLPCEGSGGAGAGLCSLQWQWQDWREPCWDHWTWTPMLVLHSQEHHWRIQLRQNVWLHTDHISSHVLADGTWPCLLHGHDLHAAAGWGKLRSCSPCCCGSVVCCRKERPWPVTVLRQAVSMLSSPSRKLSQSYSWPVSHFPLAQAQAAAVVLAAPWVPASWWLYGTWVTLHKSCLLTQGHSVGSGCLSYSGPEKH